jgi:carbonic anhydrase
MGAPGTHDTLLDEVLAANRAFLDGDPAPRPCALGAGRFLLLTCMDPRLSALLPRAFGVGPEEMVMIRNAANRASADAIRSLCAAFFVLSAKEVFVVGHTDCRMAQWTAMDVLTALAKAGVPRAALGGKDPREWFGAIGSARQNALDAAKAVRACPVLPAGTPVHALLVDSGTGALEVLEKGYDRDAARTPPPAAASPGTPPPVPPELDVPALAPPKPPAREPPPIPPPPARKPATGLGRAADVLRKLRSRKP